MQVDHYGPGMNVLMLVCAWIFYCAMDFFSWWGHADDHD